MMVFQFLWTLKRDLNDSKMTLPVADAIADLLLDSGNAICGSYIYKRMLLGERPNDIDAVSKSDYETALSPEDFDTLANLSSDHNVRIDMISASSFEKSQSDAGHPSFATSILLKKVDGKKVLLPASSRVTQGMVDYIVEQIPKRRYCPWDSMREKDKEYFGNFEVIDREECTLHGFMRTSRHLQPIDHFEDSVIIRPRTGSIRVTKNSRGGYEGGYGSSKKKKKKNRCKHNVY